LRVVNVSDGFGPSAVNVEKVVDTRVSTFAVARVWHVATRSLVAELKGHALFINSCAFSPDGTRIVTASADGTARIWDSVPYRERFKELQARGLRK
jgi:WD40 repeat protein